MSKRGKKRTKAVNSEELTRVRRDRLHFKPLDLAIDFSTPAPETVIGVSRVGDSWNNDNVSFEIRLVPPLPKIYGTSSILSLTHLQSRRTDTRIVVLPHTDAKCLTAGSYLEFPTHVAKLSPDSGSVEVVYLNLQNEQMRGDMDVPIYRPKFNFGLGFFAAHFPNRYEALHFFPPDHKGPMDLSQVPQGSLITQKPSGGITSSRVAKLLGFYPGKDVINGWKAVGIRFGQQSEVKAIMQYLNHHPNYKFKEVGFLSSENSGILDGAQCDGLVEDTETKTVFPIEFKASRFNCNFEASHMAQCIWEMGCGFPHIDLIRYCERQVKTSEGLWETLYECKEIRLYRDLKVEQKITELVSAAKNNAKLLDTPDYVDMRQHLTDLADQANRSATNLPVDPKWIQELEAYKEHTLDIQDAENVTLHPILDRIEKRQARIFAAVQEEDASKVRLETLEQIRDFCDLL